MKRLCGWLKRTIPPYLWLILCVWFIQNAAVYYVARIINQGAVFHDISLPLDRQLPLIPFFMLFYFLAYPSWFVGHALIAGKDIRQTDVIFGAMLAKLLCFAAFIVYPTTLERPEVVGGGLFGWVTRFIYWVDQPNNLCPSIHCLENYMVWRGMIGRRDIPLAVKWGFFLLMLAVFVAVLLVKQHVIVDIPAAIIVGEIGLWAARKLRLGQRYAEWYARRRPTP